MVLITSALNIANVDESATLKQEKWLSLPMTISHFNQFIIQPIKPKPVKQHTTLWSCMASGLRVSTAGKVDLSKVCNANPRVLPTPSQSGTEVSPILRWPETPTPNV